MNRGRQGFTLLEVMIATIILSMGLVVLLTSFMNCQRIMMMSRDYETAQYVLTLGETAYPLPSPDQVTDDPLKNELLNIDETDAEDLLGELDMRNLPHERMEELRKYSFERTVDEVEDEELQRSGYLYTVRTFVRWGGKRGMNQSEMCLITLWRKTK